MTQYTQAAAAREAARDKTSGRFGEQRLLDPGQLDLGVLAEPDVTRFTDDDGITWISGNPCDPRQASVAAAVEAARITDAGCVAFVRSEVLGDEVEFEVRSFDAESDASLFARTQGYTESQVNPDNTVDLFEPDGLGSCRLYLPAAVLDR